MGRPPRADDEAVQRAQEDVRNARTVGLLRAAQAVLLPLEIGLTLEQTGRALGRDAGFVSRTRNKYIRGEIDFGSSGGGRGGRRKQLLGAEAELTIVKQAVKNSAFSFTKTVRGELRQLLFEKLEFDPAESTVSAMLARAAPRLLPEGSARELQDWCSRLAEIWKLEQELERLRGRSA